MTAAVNSDDEELIIRKRKKIKPKIKKPPGINIADFAHVNEAEFDNEADIAAVSDDEDEKGNDEYEEEIITEKLPSEQRQQKELSKIHQKLQRDDDQQQLKRMEEAFMGDEISQEIGYICTHEVTRTNSITHQPRIFRRY